MNDQGMALQRVLRGQLISPDAILKYISAGKATITLVSKASGSRRTYKFARPPEQANRPRPMWVSLLSGSDNESNYSYLGTIWEDYSYVHGRKSRVTSDAEAVKVVQWLVNKLAAKSDNLCNQAEVWHEGKCGRCGRKLTVPGSIASGFGPECIIYQ